MTKRFRFQAALLAVVLLTSSLLFAKSSSSTSKTTKPDANAKISENPGPARKMTRMKKSRAKVSRSRKSRSRRARHKRRYRERFHTSSFAAAATAGDVVEGEDPIVRAAAVEALGNMNGTVVALDPDSGRVLAMVNQKLALSEGAMPCSTIKVAVALAALSEGVVTKDEEIRLGRRWRMNLTDAMAHSNNSYFEVLGRRLGFEKVSHYAHLFGLGELAGYEIEGEHLGVYPGEELSAKLGGVGRMCSFGEGISMTPLQLGAMVSAVANSGTLYYLQHPRSLEEVATFRPMIKRELEISPYLEDLMEGLSAAVEYGTARPVRYNFIEEPVLGKTGTCSKNGTRYGWFASYANTSYGRIVVVVFLQGGRPTYGPKAAEIAGRIYRTLYDQSFFAAGRATAAAEGAASGVSH